MFKNVLIALVVILPVTLIAGGPVYWRAEQLMKQDEEAAEASLKGPEMSATTLTFVAVVFSLVLGLVASLLYVWMAGRWPEAGFNVYVGLAIGLTILFNIAVVIVRPAAKMGGVPECIALNTLLGMGYGWLLPLIIG